MNDECENGFIIIELSGLIKKAEEFKNDLDCYCEFMKEMFLGTSGIN